MPDRRLKIFNLNPHKIEGTPEEVCLYLKREVAFAESMGYKHVYIRADYDESDNTFFIWLAGTYPESGSD